jgi:hypothetical protein
MTPTKRRIELLTRLGDYMQSDDDSWKAAKELAVRQNTWFTPEHIDIAAANIVECLLQPQELDRWVGHYPLPGTPKQVGIVMAGNIPLVGFHDFLCGYMSTHRLLLKLSSKDAILLKHLIDRLTEWEHATAQQVQIAERLNGCDAYIATGSNNSSRYFEQYFSKHPHIIRRNRTSVAVLDGTETMHELQMLARDVFTYFGLGCRNITQLCVPGDYDFQPLLKVFDSYEALMMHNKYHNNYEYHLAIYLLNLVPYQTNGSMLLVENEVPFSAVSVVHYRRYEDRNALVKELSTSQDIQAIVGHGLLPFGEAQRPSLSDYADGEDTMSFLCSL